MLEHRHAHFEELVEVVGDDAQEAQAFQQRDAFIAGLRQDTEIEFEGGQLAA